MTNVDLGKLKRAMDRGNVMYTERRWPDARGPLLAELEKIIKKEEVSYVETV